MSPEIFDRVTQDCARGIATPGQIFETVVQDCAKGLAGVGSVQEMVIADCAKGLTPASAVESQTVSQESAVEARVLQPTDQARTELVIGR